MTNEGVMIIRKGDKVRLKKTFTYKVAPHQGFIFHKGSIGIVNSEGIPNTIDADLPSIAFYINENISYFVQVKPEDLEVI